jgi:hypothetical protein
MKYIKDTPRIVVKFVDSDTENVLFELKDRSWMNVGEVFSDQITTTIIEQELKNRKPPKNLMVIAVAEFKQQ